LDKLKFTNLELERSSEEQHALREFLSNVLFLDLDELLQRMTEKAVSLFQAEYAWLRLLDEEGMIVTRAVAGDKEVIRLMSVGGGKGRLVGRGRWMLDNRRPLAVKDMAQETDKSGRGVAAGLHGFLGTPLFSRDQKPLGVIHVMTRSPRDFSQSDLDLIEQFANGAAIALENARLFEEVRRKSQEFEALVEINRDVAALLDLDTLLPRIAEQAGKLLKMDAANFRLVEGEYLELRSSLHSTDISFRQKLRLGESLSGKVIQENRILAIKNVVEDRTIIEEHRERLGKAVLLFEI